MRPRYHRAATTGEIALLGETIALVGGDIRDFASLRQRLIDGIDNWLVDGKSSDSEESKTGSSFRMTDLAETRRRRRPLRKALRRARPMICSPVRPRSLSRNIQHILKPTQVVMLLMLAFRSSKRQALRDDRGRRERSDAGAIGRV